MYFRFIVLCCMHYASVEAGRQFEIYCLYETQYQPNKKTECAG